MRIVISQVKLANIISFQSAINVFLPFLSYKMANLTWLISVCIDYGWHEINQKGMILMSFSIIEEMQQLQKEFEVEVEKVTEKVDLLISKR